MTSAVSGRVAWVSGAGGTVLRTTDGGRTWQPAARPAFDDPAYGAAYVPGAPTPTLVAVGPGGASYSAADGRSWTPLDTTRAYWGIAFAGPQVMERATRGWIAGPGGRLARVRFRY